MSGLLRWSLVLVANLAWAADAVPAPAPLTEAQKAKASAALEALSQEDALAEEVAPPPADDGLSKDDRLILQSLEFDLLEAERWLAEGDAAFAGEAFLRYMKRRKSFDEERIARLGARLTAFDQRQLALARQLLVQLPRPEEEAVEPGQDDEAPAGPGPTVGVEELPAADQGAADEASQAQSE